MPPAVPKKTIGVRSAWLNRENTRHYHQQRIMHKKVKEGGKINMIQLHHFGSTLNIFGAVQS